MYDCKCTTKFNQMLLPIAWVDKPYIDVIELSYCEDILSLDTIIDLSQASARL